MSDKSTVGMWVGVGDFATLKSIQKILDQTDCTFKWDLNQMARQEIANRLEKILDSAKPVTDLSL